MVHLLKEIRDSDEQVYISPRTYSRNFPELLTACAAYFLVYKGGKVSVEAARYAWTYGIATKLGLAHEQLARIHDELASILDEKPLGKKQNMQIALSELNTPSQKIEFVQKHSDALKDHFRSDEVEQFFAGVYKQICNEEAWHMLVRFVCILATFKDGHEELYRKAKSKFMRTLHSALNSVIPVVDAFVTDEAQEDSAHEAAALLRNMHGRIEYVTQHVRTYETILQYLFAIYCEKQGYSEKNMRALLGALKGSNVA
jgi:hypothetical protein